jgi:hypothetical protein
MSLYNQDQTTGKLWLRNVIGNIDSANNVLSAIYAKYSQETQFYNELINNEIYRFDVFYDCIFIETESGCFFEKINVDENFSLLPYTKFFFYNTRKTTPVDYWFDEVQNKVFFIEIQYESILNETFKFILYFYEFDLITGITNLKLKNRINLKLKNSPIWSNFTPEIEKPRLAYNIDTKNYNVSFVFRGKEKQFALLSIMLRKETDFIITKIDGIAPFITLDPENSTFYSILENDPEAISFAAQAIFTET